MERTLMFLLGLCVVCGFGLMLAVAVAELGRNFFALGFFGIPTAMGMAMSIHAIVVD